ncbi:VIT1/CCC1 transporter family protein [Thalassovita taeanensis]|uniref:Predicted Fe2+/Mn2+ transporter, VIT1/CCC1 family n=1 Tax=Thalassovita taeanensis TaxID=657014 RepID=A0A1H8Z7U7_9RHOB|nr:VIT1/CCC1 transporter family protein [Thalassovita taeanensis]SEP60413.1 Predicted Fe2+/Mn2+ transporter, VIT1/CCC1 family [Thalassovita taeanensis]
MDKPDRSSALDGIQDFLKQIVYGGNDGIVTTFAIVAGFAGAQSDGVAQIGGLAVLVFGLANLFADAVSMGLGEFLSARSQHQMYRARRATRLSRIEGAPDAEIDRFTEILRDRGLAEASARQAAEAISSSPPVMADMMLSHSKGGTAPESEDSALNGLVTFAAFVAFGVVPLLPYLLREADELSLVLSLSATLAALAALGLLRGIATGENRRRAVAETLGVGSICAAVAFVVGWLVGG